MEASGRNYLRGHVVARLAKISADPAIIEERAKCLNARDRERAARFRFPEDRARLIHGRWLLSECLRQFLEFPGGPLELTYSSRGRPALAREPEVEFSISHTGDLAAVALARGARVGIDVERIDRRVSDLQGVAERAMGEEELGRFGALPDDDQTRGFFQAWTAKEAWLKARGAGISEGMPEAIGPVHPDFSPRVLVVTAGPERGKSWKVQALAMPEGYLANVVWDDPAKKVDFGWVEE